MSCEINAPESNELFRPTKLTAKMDLLYYFGLHRVIMEEVILSQDLYLYKFHFCRQAFIH
jgi:hypothetical protein